MGAFVPPPEAPPGQEPIRTRRILRCEACWLPPSLCICDKLAPTSVRTQLVLLVHHLERFKSSNTGRLVARMIPETIVRVHGDPSREPAAPLPEGRVLLLFPDAEARVLSADLVEGGRAVLMVPDGTWGQARRISRRDPDAQKALPVKLPEGQTTRFGALRRSEREGTMSTMEAIAQALGILEGPEVEARMMQAFEAFLERTVYVRTNAARVAMENPRGGR
ncbi:tRNA-uridine aminocarboxypropyltransferase [Polyangium sp. 15x6]|uniref:tRNA-uridine aminocarboxypropyltransferase n=1 Tax=Polyangium sp. 15x6 TaxID=3042687 RepID=UPI00249B5318|nr:tRNA-uridine aminocarboxypropyltransferase [Polyangium sp. 15x6]MDI3289099.1 tRNA-uridine aminocarboxypropyltransferase [Polyangium sp. 15x6]